MRRRAAQTDQWRSADDPAATERENPSWPSLMFRTEEQPGVVVLHPSGEVDLATVSALWARLKAAGEGGRDVVVTMGGITYIDSTGIKALLDVHRLLEKHAQRMVLAEPSNVARKIIEITALEKVIPVYASSEEAVQSLRTAAEPEQGA
jgi:anti-anti-sigma factor